MPSPTPATPATRRRPTIWLGLLALLIWVLMPAWTPSRDGPNPIATLETVHVRGQRQHILLRGADQRAPVLLFLHGGPGAAVPFLAPRLHAALEEHFVVVHWDQPGAGRSCEVGSPASLEALRADALAVIDALRSGFGVERVVLAGASFGSLLGLPLAAEHPELVSGWIGESQVVNVGAAEQIALQVARDEATARGDAETLTALASLQPPLLDPREVGRLRRALWQGGHLVSRPAALLPYVPRLLFGPEHTALGRLRDLSCLASSSATLADAVRAEALDSSLTRLEVPALFVQGRHDLLAPLALVEPLAARLGGELVVLDAGHLPSVEQPEAWAEAVIGWARRRRLAR